MTRYAFGCLALCLMLAATGGRARAEMELNGVVATENYLGLREGEWFNFRNANWFQLKVAADPHERVSATANLELRNTNFAQVETVDELWDRGSVDPVSWRINQAYMDIYGLFFDSESLSLDLRLGKQHLAWGEADGFNPTNSFDPLDLECPHDFRKQLGNVSLKAVLNVGDEWFSVEGVLVPRFLPAVLPVDLLLGDDVLNNRLMPRFDKDLLPPPVGLDLVIAEPGFEVVRTETPEANVDNAMAGARIRWSMLDFDWSLSYAHARQTIPIPRRVHAVSRIASPGDEGCPQAGRTCLLVDIDDVELMYPAVEVIGFNLRGSIGDVGVWGEAALVIPEEVGTEVDARDPFGQERRLATLSTIEDEPFTKWVVGAEYTFSGGTYVNLQWVHGFFVEMTGHALHDYLFGIFRKRLMSDRLQIEITLGGELDTSSGRTALGGLGHLAFSYRPFDGSELVLGLLMTRGESATTLEMFEALDQVYCKFRTDF